jgi:hypothetical protein
LHFSRQGSAGEETVATTLLLPAAVDGPTTKFAELAAAILCCFSFSSADSLIVRRLEELFLKRNNFFI